MRDSYRSDIEMLVMPQDAAAQRDSFSDAAAAGDVEKQSGGQTLFLNEDVHSLAWRDVTVTVKDRNTGADRNLLDKTSGVIAPGQMLALMGPSGSGKTTLLNTLAQRQAPTSGEVLLNGAECSLAQHRAVSSFVEQEDTLIGSLTVEETLKFAAKLSLPRAICKAEAPTRVASLIASFGLTGQRRTLIGTPIQKGISGGQKRRVSVATQLITGPRVLYLDEPTSGLDSTASFEVMSFIRNIAMRNNLIVIASIHQPSTKTLELFSKVTLLSRGKTCFYGAVSELDPYFHSLGMGIPNLTNPSEHMLDLTNVDFGPSEEAHARLESIFEGWNKSGYARKLEDEVKGLASHPEPIANTGDRPSIFSQIFTLLQRAFIKSYRDLVAYWVRVAMYMGLAIMMGTVWLRLSPDQEHIQPFINAIFFGSAFLSFMAVAYVPAFLEDRLVFVKERANGLYGPTAFLITNFLVGLPFLFLITILFSVVSYWLINLRPNADAFFTWILWLFLDLLAAESLVVLVSSIFPNFVVALALIAFANGLWMSVGGFLVSLPVLNVFWKYVFHYIDYQAYVFQGMMVNEFKSRNYNCERQANGDCYCMYQSSLQSQCKIDGKAVLSLYGYALNKEGEWVGILIAIIVVYRLLAWGVTFLKKH